MITIERIKIPVCEMRFALESIKKDLIRFDESEYVWCEEDRKYFKNKYDIQMDKCYEFKEIYDKIFQYWTSLLGEINENN